jgi:tetratricopeptide (TPR) repeat protein
MELAPEDMILPFARSQALMAGGQYSQAAAVLREALAKVQPEKEGVFYPRGLYPDEDTLLEQIDLLAKQAESYNFDADLQLLLGYQLLGIGQTDRAVEPLMHAGRDLVNADASAVLLKLVEKIKTPSSEAEPKDKPKNGEPAPAPAPSGQSPAAPAHSHPASQAIIGGRSTRLTETMFLTSLGALATGVGIRRFTHC